MNSMVAIRRAFAVGSLLAVFCNSVGAAEPMEQGKYLVHHVAMCVQCHSPRNERGLLVETELLTGGKIPLTQPYPNRSWAIVTPALAGLPGYSNQDVFFLLTQGRRPGERPPRNPMPEFRLSDDDARAVIAYLNSLKP